MSLKFEIKKIYKHLCGMWIFTFSDWKKKITDFSTRICSTFLLNSIENFVEEMKLFVFGEEELEDRDQYFQNHFIGVLGLTRVWRKEQTE